MMRFETPPNERVNIAAIAKGMTIVASITAEVSSALLSLPKPRVTKINPYETVATAARTSGIAPVWLPRNSGALTKMTPPIHAAIPSSWPGFG